MATPRLWPAPRLEVVRTRGGRFGTRRFCNDSAISGFSLETARAGEVGLPRLQPAGPPKTRPRRAAEETEACRPRSKVTPGGGSPTRPTRLLQDPPARRNEGRGWEGRAQPRPGRQAAQELGGWRAWQPRGGPVSLLAPAPRPAAPGGPARRAPATSGRGLASGRHSCVSGPRPPLRPRALRAARRGSVAARRPPPTTRTRCHPAARPAPGSSPGAAAS